MQYNSDEVVTIEDIKATPMFRKLTISEGVDEETAIRAVSEACELDGYTVVGGAS